MSIIRQPIVTEKMNASSEKLNCYGFIVDSRANKIQIKQAIEQTYGVTVDSVKTMNYYGKRKVRQTKNAIQAGNRVQRKKAVVFLKDGDKIDFFGNI